MTKVNNQKILKIVLFVLLVLIALVVLSAFSSSSKIVAEAWQFSGSYKNYSGGHNNNAGSSFSSINAAGVRLLNSGATRGGKWGYHQSAGADGDIKSTDSEIKLDQGTSSDTRYGIIYTTISLDSKVTAAIAAGKIKMKFTSEVRTAGKGKIFGIFILYGQSTGPSLENFTVLGAKTAGNWSNTGYESKNVELNSTLANVTAIRVGVQVKKEGIGRHMEVFAQNMKLEVWVTGTTITPQKKSKVYDGEVLASEQRVYVASPEILPGNTFSPTWEGTATTNKNVGEHTLKLSGSVNNSSYYTISFGSPAKVTITRKSITVTGKNNSKIYGGSDPSEMYGPNAYTVTGLVTGESLTGALGRSPGETVSSYDILQGTVTNANNGNYDITYIEGTFTINKKALTVTIDNKEITYGDSDVGFSVTPNKPTDTWAPSAGGWADVNVSSLTRNGTRAAGTYTISQGSTIAANNPNYNITFTSSTGTYTIKKRNVTVTATNSSKVYWSTSQEQFSYTVTYSGGFNPTNAGAEIVAVGGTLARVAGENAGTYVINAGTVTNANNSNYNITSFTSGTFTINKYPITITPRDGQTKVYGQPDPSFTYDHSGYPSGSTGYSILNGALGRAAGNDVNNYAFNLGTFATASNNPNYNISLNQTANRTFSITKKTVNVTLQGFQVNYDPLKVESNYISMLTIEPLGQGVLEYTDTVEALYLNITKAPGIYAGTYLISASSTSPNYNVTVTEADFVINKVTRSIDTSYMPISMEYSGIAQFVTGARLSSVDVGENEQVAISYSNNSFTDVPLSGQLTVSISAAASTNYLATSTTYVISIDKRPITVTVDSKSSIYKETIKSLTWHISSGSLVQGQQNTVLGVSLSANITSNSNAGDYPIVATYNNNNYLVTFIGEWTDSTNGKYTITKANSVIGGSLGTYYFTGNAQTISGYTLNHSEKSIVYSNNTFTDVPLNGLQTITYSVAESANYLGISSTNEDVVVNKASTTIDITGVATQLTYNGYEQTINFGATTNHVGNYISTIQYSNNTFKNIPAVVAGQNFGLITINISVAANRNYISASETVSVRVYRAALSAKIIDVDITYGTVSYILDFNVLSGLLGNDTKQSLGITLVRTNPTSNAVGTYIISKSAQTNNNYNVNIPNGTFKINPKQVSVFINNQESIYGEREADMSVPREIAPHEAVMEQNVTSQLEFAEGIGVLRIVLARSGSSNNAGQYKIVGSQGSGKSPNYTLQFSGAHTDGDGGIYTIKKAQRVINTVNINRNYTYSGVQQTITGAFLDESNLDAGETQSIITAVNNTFTDVPLSPIEGEQIVTFSVLETTNFKPVSIDVKVYIHPYQIKINIGDAATEYSYTPVDVTNLWELDSSTPMPAGQSIDILGISASTAVTITTPIGSYPISGNWNQSSKNYKVVFSGSFGVQQTQGTYNVEKADTVITINIGEYTYNGSEQEITGITKNHNEGYLEINNYKFTDVPNDGNVPGRLVITYRMAETASYKGVPLTTHAITINKADTLIDTSAIVTNYTYIGVSRAISGATNNHSGNHISGLSYENNTFRDVPVLGYFDLIIRSASNNNYNEAEETVRINVSKADVTLRIEDKAAIYGEAEKPLTASLETGHSLKGNDRLSDIGYTLEKATGLVVGTYAIEVTGYTNGNYNVTFVGSGDDGESGNYTITQRNITIRIDNKTSAYLAPLQSLTWNFAAGSSMAYSDSRDLLSVTLEKETGAYVGEYDINGTQGTSASANYNVSFVSGIYTITKITRYIDTSSMVLNRTYNGAEQVVEGATLSANDPVGENSIVYEGNVFTDVPSSGQQRIDISVAATRNYEQCTTFVTLYISKYQTTVTLEDKQSEYKENLVALTATYDSLAGSETIDVLNLSISTTASSSSSAGTYSINASVSNSNYNATIITATYTITKVEIDLIADEKNATYGSPKALTYTLSQSLKTGDSIDSLNIVLGKEANQNVGSYPITLTSYIGTNYTFNYTGANYNILPKPITVVIESKESIYSQALSTLTFKVHNNTPLEYNQMQGVLGVELVKEEGINAGIYEITGTKSASGSNNYTLTFSGDLGTKGKYEILKADTIINTASILKTYTFSNATQTVAGDASVILNQTGDYIDTLEYQNNTFLNVPENQANQTYGTQTVTIIASGNRNYNPKTVSFDITINKAVSVITHTLTTEYTYNGAEQTVEGTVSANQIGVYQSQIIMINNKFTDVPASAPGSTYAEKVVTIQVLASRNYLPNLQNVTIKIYKAESVIDTSQMIQEYTYNRATQEIRGASLNHSATQIVYTNNTFKDVPTSGSLTVQMNVASTQNYLSTSASINITIKKATQVINLTGVKREYKKLVDTLPVTVNSGASVADPEQVVQYADNVYNDWNTVDGAEVRIFMLATTNYNAVETKVILLVDKTASVIDIAGIQKDYVYTGSEIVINTGAVLTVGNQTHQTIQYENNRFTTVAEGNGLEVRVYVERYGDYAESEVIFRINVEKADSELLLDQNSLNFVYTGTMQSMRAVSLVNHSERTVEFENNTFTTVAEGEALRARAYVSESANYKAASIDDIRINMSKASTTIDTNHMQTEFIYNGALQKSEGALINHSETSIIYMNNTFRTVADGNGKRVEVIVRESANYKGASEFVILSVSKATYNMSEVAFNDKAVDYDSLQHSLQITGTLPHGVSVSYSSSNQVNAGIYNVEATFIGDYANYNNIANKTAKLTISKIAYDFTNTTLEDADFAYNGKYQSIKITGTLPRGLDGSTPIVTYIGQQRDVGESTVVATFSTGSNNYIITTPQMSATIRISPAVINVISGKRYDIDHTEINNEVQLQTSNYIISNRIGSDSIALTYTSAFEDKNAVGAAVVLMTITAQSNPNYALPQTPYIVSINAGIKYPIDIEVSAQYLEYNNSPQQFEVVSKIKDIVVPHSIVFKQGIRMYNQAIDAGIYTMVITVEDEYAGKKVKEEAMQINRINANLLLNGRENQTYGSFEKFTSKLNTPYEMDEVADIAISYSFTTIIPEAGNHTVTATFEGSTNYEATSVTRQFIVDKRKVTLSIAENNNYVYSGKEQSVRYLLSSYASTDKDIVTIKYGEDNPVEIGSYDINVTLNNQNYILERILGPFEINIVKAPLEIFVNYQYGIEGQEMKFTFDYIGFVPGEGTDSLTSLPKIDRNVYKAGSYQIQASGASANNYEISYIPFTLDVYRKNLTRKSAGNEVLVTGLYDGESAVVIEKVQGDVFFDGLFRLSNSVTSAYRVEVIGNQNKEIDNTQRMVLIKNSDIKVSPFVGAYFIDNKGNKVKLSKKDINNGYIEAAFDTDVGYIVVYKNHLLWIILGAATFGIIVITLIVKKLSRIRGSRLASKYNWVN